MTANTVAKNNKSFLSIAEQESKKNVFLGEMRKKTLIKYYVHFEVIR